ncbi:p450 domain-containing protein [Cephalotus follicularis]|uniref:p450 domain-containing protein n=1 Tax=Cephalotus follicularis TaxID=3775 RepID=A0A1Q3BUH1_CEPFO|nr:p450 domain-containing protein [Cephalotus follicularis]
MAFIGFFEIFIAVICFLIFGCLGNNNGQPKNFPVVGMMPELILNAYRCHDWLTDIFKRSQLCTFLFKGIWFSCPDILVTVDPANVHYIMSTNFSNFIKGPNFKEIFDILGDGIFNSDANMWKNQRRVLTSLVNHKRFYKYMMRTTRDKLENGLLTVLQHASEKHLVVDIQDLFRRFTFDSTCTLITGYDPGCLSIEFPEVQFAKALHDVEDSIFYRHVMPESIWKLQRWLGIGQEKKMSQAKQALDHILAKYISMKRKELNKGNMLEKDGEEADILKSCMIEDDILGLNTGDKFLRDMFLNLMVAGTDTTSAALSWFFWIVSQKPEVENKIREELKSKSSTKENEKWGLYDIEELKKLVYLHAALCETLRLYPPVPFERKAPLRPDILPSGHRVVPKSEIMLLLYSMGRMPSIWGKDCLEFKPERWITEKGGIRHEPSYKFFAFNAGPRTCLGKDMAFTQMKVMAATIIHNYHFELVKDNQVVPRLSVILHMKHGLKVKVTRRRVELYE